MLEIIKIKQLSIFISYDLIIFCEVQITLFYIIFDISKFPVNLVLTRMKV